MTTTGMEVASGFSVQTVLLTVILAIGLLNLAVWVQDGNGVSSCKDEGGAALEKKINTQ